MISCSLMNASLVLVTIVVISYLTCVGAEDASDSSDPEQANDTKSPHFDGILFNDTTSISDVDESSNDSLPSINATNIVFSDVSQPLPKTTLRMCSTRTFFEVIYHNFCPTLRPDREVDDGDEDGDDDETSSVTRRIVCSERTDIGTSLPTVNIYNSSQLLGHLGSRTNNSVIGRCTVVLFYAPWCMFCVRMAPHYNALARAFPTLDVVAIDAYHFSSLNSRFGTIAVPNIMIFHNAKAVARFNGTDRTLGNIAAFVTNITGIQSNSSVEVLDEDFVGPLSSKLSDEPDYLLVLSWVFVIVCAIGACVRSSTGHRVWNTLVALGNHGQGQHLHID